MLEVTSMVDFSMICLRRALQEPWMENQPNLRPCVISGKVDFAELRGVVEELIAVWDTIRECVRYTGTRHIKYEVDKVRFIFALVV